MVPGLDISLVAPSTDILGNSRPSPSGSNPDIGAYENSSSEIVYNPNKYVSVNGDNGNLGIITDPWRDIQYAINQSQDGDIIHIAAGTYIENVNLNGKDISIFGEDKESTIIDGNNSGRVITINQDESDIWIRNLTLQNGYAINDNSDNDNSNGGGIYINSNNPPILIENCIIRNNTGTTLIQVYQHSINGTSSPCLLNNNQVLKTSIKSAFFHYYLTIFKFLDYRWI